MTLDDLNALPAGAAHEALGRCCGASAWVERMCAARPFASREELLSGAGEAAAGLGAADWREAFSHHPRIGDLAGLRERFASTAAWAEGEQRGAAEADEEALRALAEGNAAYEEKFGHVFIVCATGRSAGEMLAMLRERIQNSPERELGIAAEEQMRITRIRLEKLLDGAS